MGSFLRTKQRLRRRGDEPSVLRHIFLGVLVILSIVAIASLIYYLTRRESVTIREIAVSGGETIPHETVSAAAERALTGNYLLLVPYRFAFLYPHDRIVEEVGRIPRVHGVAVERTSPRGIHITFEEHVPSALWCLTEAGDSPCSFLTEDGFAFAPAPELLGGSLIRFVEANQSEIKTGQIIPVERMGMVRELAARLESELNFRIVQAVHTADGDLELHIGGGGKLLTTPESDIELFLKNLKTVLASKEFDHLEPGNFNYIDLRFGNKLFVNEELAPVATSTEVVATST